MSPSKGQPCSSRSLCLSASTQNGLWPARSCSELKPYFCKHPAELSSDGVNPPSASTTTTTTPASAMPATNCQWDAPYITAPPPPAGLCNSGWTYNRLTENCWQMATDTANWPHMLGKHCLGFGNAISILSPEVNCAVEPSSWFSAFSDRRWQWTDSSTVDYLNWTPGGDRHCTGKGDCGVGMWLTKDEKFGTWIGYEDGRRRWA
ncbi:hypothetical protein AAVH_16275 [Aphelenchoides avenae]|nr:hypothetical protein AAVH_16275 [Aphelenchus avenae]